MLPFSMLDGLPRSAKLAILVVSDSLMAAAAIWFTNLARVGSRQHWVSDTVAGSVLGYAIGKMFWESSRAPAKGTPRVLIHPAGINLAWGFK